MADTDWGSFYAAHVDAVTALTEGLDADALASTVPATPAWTVKQVLAHLAGGPTTFRTGTADGAPGDDWTARHVAERTDSAVVDLVAEMRGNVEFVRGTLEGNPRPAIAWDVATHHADLHEALGRGRLPEALYLPIAESVGAWRAPDLVGTVDPYELFRACFSRRSRAQLRAWDVELDDEQVEQLGVFGPRDDDQPVPPA